MINVPFFSLFETIIEMALFFVLLIHDDSWKYDKITTTFYQQMNIGKNKLSNKIKRKFDLTSNIDFWKQIKKVKKITKEKLPKLFKQQKVYFHLLLIKLYQ